ncbi:MAG: TraG family conjugative transposon ATPase, partial [Prevotella sp.]|nr:TraG family conjugative transposon ATPase [Prevotella sp.]
MTLIVILGFILFLAGMAVSVYAFGTGGKRANTFKDIYFSIEDVDGVGVLYTKTGEYSAILKMENPVQKYSADTDCYYDFTNLMTAVVQTLGEGYALHKQDVFVRKSFDGRALQVSDSGKFLSNAYFRFFNGRPYIEGCTYLVITQESKKSALLSYDNSKWRDFLVKIRKVADQLHDGGIKSAEFLNVQQAREYADRFFALNFRDAHFSMTNFKVDSEAIHMGTRQCKVYSLLDVDSVGLPGVLRPYVDMTVNNAVMPVDLMSEIDHIPDVDTVVYNQIIFLPNQKRELALLDKKKNRHASIPNPSNQMAVEDIKQVQEVIAREGKQLVYAHYNLIVAMDAQKDMQKVTNHLENIFSRQGIHISKRAYNQLELFVASFPGNVYRLSQDYDRFLTLSDAALCLMYKERQTHGDDTPVKCYYTDRQGVPMPIDTTGKEGKIKYTNNSNFFVLGPSGSGKSFFMNTVVRQYYEQNTDVVIVDTGDSYEGLCSYFGGTYISYSKEKPISMNPFKVTETEYLQNFGEKKNFLMSLIFLIFKGSQQPTKIEQYIIERTIIEYYREYFTPFKGFSEEEKKELHQTLVIAAKSNGEYERYEEELQTRNGTGSYDVTAEERAKYERNSRLSEKLQAVVDDAASTEGEKNAARNQLQRLTPEIVEGKFLEKIEREIVKREQQRKSLRVRELSFNSYYEFARQRIPQIIHEDSIQFPINDFAAILKPFYRGGALEYTLNNDMDGSLFDEQFIVFEIDKVKDDPVLFPIIVLIIMDVFTQKMRIKNKVRKCLVIEEAWKAIATPVMAEYIKYLYKTARKHWAMVGVVTQEIQDITSSPIVKEAIINNSDVFMLLDQSKFKDKFDDIKATLALTDIDCKKIFTINRLDNKVGRSPFKEVFIKRGTEGDVFGIEEPRECYMSYTTEKAEKEALKLYRR